MSTLHICNTFFEWELENPTPLDLSEAFAQHVVFKQLQFLPVLYGKEKDGVLVCETPNPEYLLSLPFTPPTLHLLSDKKKLPFNLATAIEDDKSTQPFDFKQIQSWGPSLLIAKWAKKHTLNYSMPPWEIVKQVHSKQFSFEQGSKLPQARLLNQATDATEWLSQVKGKKVLKTCFGTSGKGHLIIDEKSDKNKILSFLQKEWNKSLPVIAEPWVERILDFSTQWLIEEGGKILYLGSTLCKNNPRGQYESSEVGNEEHLFGSYLKFLQQHQEFVIPVLKTMQNLGWFGHVGIDAFIYQEDEIATLHPLVEINARKTMGFVALMLQQHHFPGETVSISYSHNTAGYLPSSTISSKLKKSVFRHNLAVSKKDTLK